MFPPKNTQLKIAIVGQGAIGALLAYQCHNLGYDYQLLLRTVNTKKVTEVPTLSLQIEDIKQQITHLQPKVNDINQATNFDLLILPVKAYQVLPALTGMQEHIQPHQVIVLLHNGMGTIEQVKQLLPNNPCIAATTSYGAFKPNSNTIKQTGLGETHLGWITPCVKNQTQLIENTLSTLLPPSVWHQDISLALWKKLAINAAINPLTALKSIKNGDLSQEQFSESIHQVCAEVCLVMQKIGYEIQLGELLALVMNVINKTANNYSSMHQDIYHNRKTEIEFINGHVVNTAQKLGLKVPKNEILLSQINKLATKNQE